MTLEEYARRYPFSYDALEIPDIGRTVERHYPDPDHKIDAWARRFVERQTRRRHDGDPARHGGGDPRGVPLQSARRDGHAGSARHAGLRQRHLPGFRAVPDGGRRAAWASLRALSRAICTTRTGSGEESVVGGGATHAWAQIYLPGGGLGRVRSDQCAGRRTQPDPRRGGARSQPGHPAERQLHRARRMRSWG